MEDVIYSANDIQALTAEIQAAQANPQIANLFCEGWPTARQVLQALQNLLTNPIAKAAIGIVIAAGDAIQGAICK